MKNTLLSLTTSAILLIPLISCTGKDEDDPVTVITLDKTTLSLDVGESERITAKVEPNQRLAWANSDSSVVLAELAADHAVTITAKSAGSANITAAVDSDRSISATCTVTVNDVYVAGCEYRYGVYAPVIWKNGQTQYLGAGSGMAESVFVYNNDVYVAGYEGNVGKIWRNGLLYQNLGSGAYPASLYVSNGNIYVAGYGLNTQGLNVATLWVNGTTQRLSTDESYAYCVHVSGGDVYVAGERRDQIQSALLWKNGSIQVLGGAMEASIATSVTVSGGIVYVAGVEATASGIQSVVLWRNGTPQRISDGRYRATAHSVFVSGNDVYISGGQLHDYVTQFDGSRVSTAAVWKNGNREWLSNGANPSYARSVYVKGGNVYAVGLNYDVFDEPNGMLWRDPATNDRGYYITNHLTGNGQGRSVFVN